MAQVLTERAVRTAARPARVLIVEDNRESADALSTLLGLEGFDVRVVYSGCEALAVIEQFDADAALIDLRLLDLNGWEVARRIRRARGADRPLLIAMSGEYACSSQTMLEHLAGFEHFIAKPYELDDVLAALAPVAARRA